MVIRKSWLISLCLIFGLSQMPAAHAQLVQLIAAVVKVLPKLLRGNQGNRASQGDPWTGNGKHIPSQSANTDAQSSGSHSGDTNDKESNSKPKSEDDLASSPPAVQDSPKIFVNTTERQITRQPEPIKDKGLESTDLASYCREMEKRITMVFDEHPISQAKTDVLVTFEVTSRGVPFNIRASSRAPLHDPQVLQQAKTLVELGAPFKPVPTGLAGPIRLKVHITEQPHARYREYGVVAEYEVIQQQTSQRTKLEHPPL